MFGDLPSFSTCTEKESNLKYHLVEAKRFAKRQTRTPHLIHDDFKSAFNYKFMVSIFYGVVYWVHLILGLEVSFRAAVWLFSSFCHDKKMSSYSSQLHFFIFLPWNQSHMIRSIFVLLCILIIQVYPKHLTVLRLTALYCPIWKEVQVIILTIS